MGRRRPPPAASRSFGCGGCLLLVAVLGGLGSLLVVGLVVLAVATPRTRPVAAAATEPSRPAPPPPPATQPVFRELLADQTAANLKYSDAVITASGKVELATWHANKSVGVLVKVSDVEGPHSLVATFKPPHAAEALNLQPGTPVTVRGKYTGSVVGGGKVALFMSWCELVP